MRQNTIVFCLLCHLFHVGVSFTFSYNDLCERTASCVSHGVFNDLEYDRRGVDD